MSELRRVPLVWPVRVYFEDTEAGGVVYHSSAGITLAMLHADSRKPAWTLAWVKAELENGGSTKNAE